MKYFTTLFFFFIISGAHAQSVQIKGRIIDQSTGLPLSHINVGFSNAAAKSRSDADGRYTISTNAKVKELNYSGIGYKKQVRAITQAELQELNVSMEPLTQDLSEVSVVAAKQPRYKNKNNPAVELIRKVMEHKEQNSSKFHKEMVFEQYEKLNMSLSINSEKAKKSKLLKKLPFLIRNSDSLRKPGKHLIPVFMQEKLSRHKYSAQGQDSSQVLGEKQSRIDQYIDEDGINEYLEKVYQRADLYDHDIGMGNQRFLSPIADMAPQFYKYFILDTLKDVSPWQIRLMVSPKNKQDVLFMGYLYVSLDGHYAVQRATLSVNNQINLNWVRDLQIALDYRQDSSGHYHLEKSVMSMDLGIFKEGTSVFGERTIMVNDFVFGPQALEQKIGPNVIADQKVNRQPEDFWEKSRHEKLSPTEQMAYTNIDSLKSSKPFKRKMAVAALVLSGYLTKGPVEIGPFNSFFSFNTIEGARFRFGGRTTEEFSKKLVFDGHAAYGTKDQKWKYSLGAIYSLTDRSIYQFPVRSLTVRHSFETQIPGQELNFLEDDNFLLSFKRGVNDKWLYNRKWMAEYLHETEQHLSLRLTYKNQSINPAGGLVFLPQTAIPSPAIRELRTSEFSAELRWAPHEKFYQGKRFRRPINNGYPVFTLRGSLGLKDFLGGDYNYQSLTLNVAKRFFLSQFGFSDVVLEGGAVFGKVPYPLLSIHRANQTYAYQLTSYNLMNFMEFMSDRYASLNLQHSFNGFFLNKVPLIKKLQWREVISVKVLTGSISAGNDPAKNPQLYRFPFDGQQNPRSFAIGNVPYVEGSVGVSNVFKFLRVDFVKRFTHLNNPGVSPWGIRAKINVDF